MATTKTLFAGFGGQGILFSGKFLAYYGLLADMNVSWLPSYGPEMRGGTASCSVILSDAPVGSPIIDKPDVLIAMNLPSLDKYEDAVAVGGKIFVDSSLIERKVAREDVEVYRIPATRLASDNDMSGLANMIMLGNVIAHTGIMPVDAVPAAMAKVVSAKKQHLLELNIKAVQTGIAYTD